MARGLLGFFARCPAALERRAMSNLSQIYDVDLKLLRCFCTIVEEGSFTAAQVALNLSQSSLSEYLKSLEVRLGARLCQRGPKGFKLFKEGELVYAAAKELFASIETFKQKASNVNEHAAYELAIGIQDAIVDNPQSRIPEAIQRFSQYYPNVRFRTETLIGHQLAGRVADGMLHVGVGLVYGQFQQLQFEHLFDERSAMCCGVGHPLFGVPDAELTRTSIESAAYCNRGHLEPYHPERAQQEETRGDIGHGAQAQLTLILSGRNVGYVLDHLAQAYVESGRLRKLRPDLIRLTVPVGAVVGPAANDFKLANRFVDCLVDVHMESVAIAARQAQAPRPRLAVG